MRRFPQRHVALDVLDDVVNVPPQEPDPPLLGPLPSGEALAHADRSQRVGARENRLARAQEGDVRAASPDLDEGRVAGPQHLVVAEDAADRHVGQAVLLGAIDDLGLDPGA